MRYRRLKSRWFRFRSRQQPAFESLEPRCLLAGDFTFAVLPDTQFYSEQYPATFEQQTQWIVDNLQTNNIKFVTHVGDVVENPSQAQEWANAEAAIDRLDGDLSTEPDGLVPYSIIPGNHDYDGLAARNGLTSFSNSFGEDRYAARSWYGGSSPDGSSFFQVVDAGDYQFLHLGLEWEPRDTAMVWSQGVLDTYQDLPTVVTTHAYLHKSGGRFVGATTPDGHDGEQIFQELIRPNPQVFLVVGGHYPAERHEVSLNDAGLPVHELLVDYQSRPNGGDGWLQLLTFKPDLNRIDVTTYSPTLDQFETDANSQFSLPIDFAARFNLSAPPAAQWQLPIDNGPADLDPTLYSVTSGTTQGMLRFQLTDHISGVDDATVIADAVSVHRDGAPLTAGVDFDFSYDALADQITLSPIGGDFGAGHYQILFSPEGNRIADLDGITMEAMTVLLEVDPSLILPPEAFFFSLRDTATLPGGIIAEPSDVMFFDGTEFTAVFRGADVGLSGETIDGLAVFSDHEWLLSFTGSVNLPGISSKVDDSDIVRFSATQLGEPTAGTFSLYFDGSDVGLSTSDEDIEALDLLPDGRLLISTRGTASVPGVDAADEDILLFDPTSLGDDTAGTWSIYFSGSDVGLANEDVNAVSVFSNGDLYLSLTNSANLPQMNVRDEDVFQFRPTTLGDQTEGSFLSPAFFDGSNYGIGADIYSVQIFVPSEENLRPIAEDDDAVAAEDSSLTIDVLADNGNGVDHDEDGTLVPSTAEAVIAPSHGSLINNGDGTFVYTPHANFAGFDNFAYTVEDDGGRTSNVATVRILVEEVNDAPQANDDVASVDQNQSAEIDVLSDNGNGADFDVDGTLVAGSVSVVAGPHFGQLTNQGDGTLVYLPNPGFLGQDTFSYVVQDDQGATSNVADVTIQVTSASILYFSVDRSVTLPNSLFVKNEDIVAYDGVGFSMLFDGSDVGLHGEAIAAFAVLNDSEILLALGSSATLDGVTDTVTTADVVKFTATQLGSDTAGQYELYFQGGDVGLSGSSEKIDGLDLLPDGRLILSTNGSPTVPGVSARDEDLLAFTPTALGEVTEGTWELYFEGGPVGIGGEDIDAVAIGDDGRIYMSTQTAFALSSVSGDDEDVLAFTPTALGAATSGSFDSELAFDGSLFGLLDTDIRGIDWGPAITAAGAGSTVATGVAANPGYGQLDGELSAPRMHISELRPLSSRRLVRGAELLQPDQVDPAVRSVTKWRLESGWAGTPSTDAANELRGLDEVLLGVLAEGHASLSADEQVSSASRNTAG